MLSQPGTLNPYIYGLNNPVMYTDPSGEFALSALLLVGALGGFLGGATYYTAQVLQMANPCTGLQWKWQDALMWSGAGAVIGVLLGAGIYGAEAGSWKLLGWILKHQRLASWLGLGGTFAAQELTDGDADEQRAADLLQNFVENRLGKNPQNVNCYGCALNEYPTALGKPPLINDLSPNPWGVPLSDQYWNFVEHKVGDQILGALQNGATQIAANEAMRGDLVSWHYVLRPLTFPGSSTDIYSYMRHIGIYLGNGEVFSKLGREGAYAILSFKELSDIYTNTGLQFWRLP